MLLKRSLQTLLVLFLSLIILEIAYRYQWIDFYKTEYKALNEGLDTDKESVVFFGDSFTAHPEGYVDLLGEEQDKYALVNCAVPGTGPLEMSVMAADRIEAHKPSMIVYQLYVGNDLIDISPPINWGELSYSRNMYWLLKKRFQILTVLSKRFRGIQSDFDADYMSQGDVAFHPDRFSPRSRMLIKADPDYVEQCVAMHESYECAVDVCLEKVEYLKSIAPENAPVYLVVIPHFSQVSQELNDRYVKLGGSQTGMESDYPFIEHLKGIDGITVLNPMEAFRTAIDNGEKVYFENDPHLTDKGQEVLASFLKKHIFSH